MKTLRPLGAKKFIAVILPAIFILFIGCGGGKEDEPPPMPPCGGPGGPQCPDQQSMQDLLLKAMQMKAICANNFATVMRPMLVVVPGRPPMGMPPRQGVPPSQLVNPSAVPGQAPMGMPGYGGPQPQVQQDCFNAAMNFKMLADTTMNGQAMQFGPFAQWTWNQFRQIGDRVNGMLGGLSPQQQQIAKAVGMQVFQTQIAPRLPAGMLGAATSMLSSAGIGLR